MTDQFEVGEAAARAPRLEPSYLLRRAADALREWIQQDGWTDASVHNHVEYSKEVLAELEAARAPREPLEPIAEAFRARCDARQRTGPHGCATRELRCIDCVIEQATDDLTAARSALHPLQTPEEKEDARVEPSCLSVAPIGSTAERQRGSSPAAERTDPTPTPWHVCQTRAGSQCFICSEDGFNVLNWPGRARANADLIVQAVNAFQSAALPRAPEPDLEARCACVQPAPLAVGATCRKCHRFTNWSTIETLESIIDAGKKQPIGRLLWRLQLQLELERLAVGLAARAGELTAPRVPELDERINRIPRYYDESYRPAMGPLVKLHDVLMLVRAARAGAEAPRKGVTDGHASEE